MNSSSKMFVQGFMVLGGVILIFLGMAVKSFLPFIIALPFFICGVIVVIIALYWLYKDFQKG
jgi:hypothetical protein